MSTDRFLRTPLWLQPFQSGPLPWRNHLILQKHSIGRELIEGKTRVICFSVDNFMKKSESCTILAGLLCVVAAQTFLQGSSEVLPWDYSFCRDFRLEFLCSWNAILPPSNIRGMDIKLATPATTKPKQLVPLLPRYFQLHSKIQSMLAGIWEINKQTNNTVNVSTLLHPKSDPTLQVCLVQNFALRIWVRCVISNILVSWWC